jgi:hypothetical protein
MFLSYLKIKPYQKSKPLRLNGDFSPWRLDPDRAMINMLSSNLIDLRSAINQKQI